MIFSHPRDAFFTPLRIFSTRVARMPRVHVREPRVEYAREYTRDNHTSTNKVRVCVDLTTFADVDYDLLLVVDGLTRHVKVVSPNAAVAVLRVVIQLAWRLARDAISVDSSRACFTIELSYDEYSALVAIHQRIREIINEKIRAYSEMLEHGKARDVHRVAKRITQYRVLMTLIDVLVNYHKSRRRR